MESRFSKSREMSGWPEPTCSDVRDLSNLDLADYLGACGQEFDGVPDHVREALVRLLLYHQAHMPAKRL